MTRREMEAFNFIDRYRAKHGLAPSYQEMADALGLASKSGVHRLVLQLEAKGWIRVHRHRARAIEITRQPLRDAPARPMVLGDLYPLESVL